jgi:hypothetical protein
MLLQNKISEDGLQQTENLPNITEKYLNQGLTNKKLFSAFEVGKESHHRPIILEIF